MFGGIFTPGRGDCDCEECLAYASIDLYNPHLPDWEPVQLHDPDCDCDDCVEGIDPSMVIDGMDFD